MLGCRVISPSSSLSPLSSRPSSCFSSPCSSSSSHPLSSLSSRPPSSSLFPSFGSFPSSFPSHFPSSSFLLLLIVSPSPSSSFSLPAPRRFPPSCRFPHLHLLVVLVVSPAYCHIMDSEHEPRQTSWLVFRNSTRASHLMGPPRVPLSLDPPSSEAKPPTSLWKGEGRLGAASSLVRELGRC